MRFEGLQFHTHWLLELPPEPDGRGRPSLRKLTQAAFSVTRRLDHLRRQGSDPSGRASGGLFLAGELAIERDLCGLGIAVLFVRGPTCAGYESASGPGPHRRPC